MKHILNNATEGLAEPWVAYKEGVVYYMPKESIPFLLCNFNITDISEPFKFYTWAYPSNQHITSIVIDGKEFEDITSFIVDGKSISYQFDTVGVKQIKLIFDIDTIGYGGPGLGLGPNLTSITIGDGVTSIGENAFYSCSSLTSVHISDSVTSIGNNVVSLCSNLVSITVDPQNTVYYSDGNCCMKDSEVVFGCKTSVIPTTATSIGQHAFYNCTNLTSVTIPDNVTNIGDEAFRACTNLTSVTIPNNVTSIGTYAFGNCSNLTSVTYNGITYTSKSALATALTNGGVAIGSYVFDFTALND